MSNFGVKTPVSCLQEYLVSKKMIPHYELTHNKMGTHNPEFTFRVQVGALWEEGTGRSKQEAKHRAAEKMLKSLKVIDEKITEEEATNELKMEPTQNYVGQLKELCYYQHYPEPNYYLEEAAGPDHSRVFKMVCCVSQLQDFGVSRTKKQAKHEAAFKMLQRLKEVSGKKIEVSVMNPGSQIKVQSKTASVTDEEITDKYNALKPTSVPVNKDPTVFYKDHHKAYVHLQETSPTLTNIIKGSCEISVENSLSLVEKIAKELEMSLDVIKVPSKEKEAEFTVMSMSVFPPISAVGQSEKLAALNLIESLLVLCKA